MKRTILFTCLALLVGLALTFSQVFAAAPGLAGLKKTPAPESAYPAPDQGKGPGNEQGKGPGNSQGNGPSNDQGKGPGNEQGKGPGNSQGNGPDHSVGNGQDQGPSDNAGQGADKNKDKSNQPDKSHPGKSENFCGLITGLEGDLLTVTLKDGSTQTVTLDEATKIHLAKLGWDGTLADLKDGLQITVHLKKAVNGSQPVDIHVIPDKASLIHVVGTVTHYQAGDTTLTVQTQDGPLTLDISNSKLVKGKDADLADGALVTVIRSQDETGAVKAVVVHPTKAK